MSKSKVPIINVIQATLKQKAKLSIFVNNKETRVFRFQFQSVVFVVAGIVALIERKDRRTCVDCLSSSS